MNRRNRNVFCPFCTGNVKKLLTNLFSGDIIALYKSDDEEGRDHFASQRAGALLKAGIRDDPDDYRFRAGTPNKKRRKVLR